MKSLNPIVLAFIMALSGSLIIPAVSHAQLSGSYTINPRQAASNSNYQNWASAVSDLVFGSRTDLGTVQGPGVGGPVVITVYDSVYPNTQVTIAAISGASSTNTITFKSAGGDSTTCKLQYASSASATGDYVLRLDGADFITFQEIGFERTGTETYSTVIEITNDADNNRFLRCWMKGRKMPSSTTLGFQYGIGSCIFFTGNGDNTQIIQNKMLYGYNGVYSFQASSNNLIRDNVLDTIGNIGVYMTQQTGVKVLNNTFNMGDFGTGQGHYVSYGIRLETSPSFEIRNNIIRLLAVNATVVRGIVMVTNTSTATAPAQVINNFITVMGQVQDNTGLALYGADYINIYYNNVLATGTLATGAAYFHHPSYVSTHVKLVNNNFVNSGSGYAATFTNTAASIDFDTIDYNNIYSAGSKLVNWVGTDYTSFNSYRTASSKDAHSLNVDPGYKSNTNLHVTNLALKEKARPYSSVPTDIDGDVRNATTPDIGADEFPYPQFDATIIAITKPLNGSCEGLLEVSAVIQNLGTDTLKSATVNWYIAGTAQTPANWTGNLARLASDTVSLGTYLFTSRVNIAARSLMPNGQTDQMPANDSLVASPQIFVRPTVNAGVDSAICMGDSIQLGTAGGSGATFQWLDLSNNVLGTSAQLKVSPATQTSYVLELTSTSTGCSNRDTVQIDVNPVPTADAGLDQAICFGDSVQIGTAAQTGNSYAWTSIPAGFSANSAMPYVSPTITTDYILEQSLSTGCSSYDTVTVMVNPLPAPMITGADSICMGGMESYTTTSNTGSSYTWMITGGQLMSGQNTDSVSVEWNTVGSGSIMVTETSAAGCMDSMMQDVTVSPNPAAKMVITGSCANRDVSFMDTSSNVQSRLWRFGDGQTATGATESYMYTNTGSYTAKLIVTNSFGCMDSMEQTLNIVDAPTADFSASTPICEGENIDFTNASVNATTYMWTFESGQTSTMQDPSFVFTAAGDYDVKLVAYGTGCNDSLTKPIIVNALPDASFTIDPPTGQSVQFTANNTSGATYMWDFGDGKTSQLASPVHPYTDMTGWKIVTLTVTSTEGCSASYTDSVFVTVIGIKESLPASLLSLVITPNPFHQQTLITLELAKTTDLEISLYDMQGRRISTLVSGSRESGTVQAEVSSDNLGLKSGVYVLRVMLNGTMVTRQLVRMD